MEGIAKLHVPTETHDHVHQGTQTKGNHNRSGIILRCALFHFTIVLRCIVMRSEGNILFFFFTHQHQKANEKHKIIHGR